MDKRPELNCESPCKTCTDADIPSCRKLCSKLKAIQNIFLRTPIYIGASAPDSVGELSVMRQMRSGISPRP